MKPGEAKAVQNVVEQTENFHNQKEELAKRKEFLKTILEGVYSPLTDPRKGGN